MNISFDTDAPWHSKYFFVYRQVVCSIGTKEVEEELQDNSEGHAMISGVEKKNKVLLHTTVSFLKLFSCKWLEQLFK